MADFFLSNLKSTLDNCITELDEIHSMFEYSCAAEPLVRFY